VTTATLIEIGKVAAAVAAVATLLGLIARWLAGALRLTRKVGKVVDEVLGDDDKPGWGARITSLEDGQARVTALVERIDHEVKPNSGKSLHDKITRIERATGAQTRER
jgi:hypothetical protein